MQADFIPTFNPEQFAKLNYRLSEQESVFAGDLNTFTIHPIEQHKELLKLPLLPHRKTVHDFLYLTAGTVRRSKGLDTYQLTANTFFFLPAYQATATDFASPDAAGYYCHFNNQILSEGALEKLPFFHFLGNPVVLVPPDLTQPVHHLLRRLEQLHHRADAETAGHYLLALFAELKRVVPTPPLLSQNTALHITERFKSLLVQNVYEVHTVAGYADLLALTPNHLNKCVRRSTGRTAQVWIADMVLLEAQVLLRQTALHVSEIAFRLTRQDGSVFGRFFKDKTGLTPTQYRQLNGPAS